jgi:hypothetical protein
MCVGCNTESYIYKNITGKKYCKSCAYKINPPSKIKKTSEKKKKQDDEYSKLRKLYLDTHSFCEAKLPGVCTGVATDIHHLYSGKDRNKYYLDDKTWKAICRNCHIFIHDKLSTEEAIELNLKKNE